MKDTIIKNTGNSRNLRSSIAAGTTWDQALSMLRNGTFPIDLLTLRSDGCTQIGTYLNKTNILPDDLAASMGVTPEGSLATFLAAFVTRGFVRRSLNESNLNNMTDVGYYWISALSNATNGPAGVTGSAFVLVYNISGAGAVQIMYVLGQGIWIRSYQSDTWSSWVHYLTSDEVATSSANGLMSAADKAAFDASVMQSRTAGSTASLDDFKTGGAYWVTNASQVSNWPYNETANPKYGSLMVYVSGNVVVQILLMYNNGGMYRTYTRMYANNQWYAWNNIVADSSNRSLTSSMRNTTNINELSGFYRKVGSQVVCHFELTANTTISAGSLAEAFTLPVGYRPSDEIWLGQAQFDGNLVLVQISSSGKVIIKPYVNWSTSAGPIFGTLNFFI